MATDYLGRDIKSKEPTNTKIRVWKITADINQAPEHCIERSHQAALDLATETVRQLMNSEDLGATGRLIVICEVVEMTLGEYEEI